MAHCLVAPCPFRALHPDPLVSSFTALHSTPFTLTRLLAYHINAHACIKAVMTSTGGRQLRVRKERTSYKEISDSAIHAEARRVERVLALRERGIIASIEDVEEEYNDDDDAVEEEEEEAEPGKQRRRSARVSGKKDASDDEEEYGEDDANEDEEADGEENGDGGENSDEDAPITAAPGRSHLSRTAKLVGSERVRQSIRQSVERRGAHPPTPPLTERIVACLRELGLQRHRNGFTMAKVRNYMMKEDEELTTKRFKHGWEKAADAGILRPVIQGKRDDDDDDDDDEEGGRKRGHWWRLDRQTINEIEKAKKREARGARSRRNSTSSESMDGSDAEDASDSHYAALPSTAGSWQTKSLFLPPGDALLLHLSDGISPFRQQIEESKQQQTAKEAEEAKLKEQEGQQEQEQEGESGEGEHKAPPANTGRRTRSGRRIADDDEENGDDDTAEPKEESKEAVEKSMEADNDGDAVMTDANDATPSTTSISPEQEQAQRDYLKHRGPALLRDFILGSILAAPQHKLSLAQLQESITALPHLPTAFAQWALHGDAEDAMMDESKEECKRDQEIASPLETCLQLLATLKLIHKPISARSQEYRATSMAIDYGGTIQVPRGIVSGRGHSRGRMQVAHALHLRGLKVQMGLKLRAFVHDHRDVFAPFVTNHKECQLYGFDDSLRSDTVINEEDRPKLSHDFPIYPIPKAIAAPEMMRDYQLKGFSFLAHLHDNGAHGILADEMGLGKSLQVLLFFSWLKENRGVTGPHMIVVPLTVLDTWITECHRWTPNLRIVRFHGHEKERKRIFDEKLQHGQFDILVTTYETVVVAESFFKHHFFFAYLVVDEAHRIKNENSLLSVALRHISCAAKLLLTGTPLQNDLHELWALLNFLYPSLFTSSAPFDQGFNLNAQRIDQNILSAAQSLLFPIMIRRLKRQVAVKLPPKTETQVKCPLAPLQVHWYRALLASHAGLLDKIQDEIKEEENDAALELSANNDLTEGDATVLEEQAQLDAEGNIDKSQLAHLSRSETPMREESDGVGGPGRGSKKKDEGEDNFGLGESARITASAGNEWRKLLNLMMQLRKCCLHPYLFPHSEPNNATADDLISASGKMQVLDKLLKKLFISKHRVLIFSSFIGMLDLLERMCMFRRYKFLRLDGSTTRVQRRFDIARFQASDEFFIYLISTRAGGLGITLNKADTVIHFDSDWNPQVDLQAQDRAHRIGQTKPVRVFRLVSEQTVEERVIARAQRKLYLDAMITSGAAGLQSHELEKLSKSELLGMLRFGSDAVFQSNGKLEDRDIDAILAGATTEEMSEEKVEERAQSVLKSAKLDCASFDSAKLSDLAVREFGGRKFTPTSYRSIADSWVGASSHKRERQSTTVQVGQDRVLKRNNYDMGSFLGRAMDIKMDMKPVHVQYKPFIENESYCGLCHEGGVLLLCSGCPRSFHAACVGRDEDDQSSFRCPQHSCTECGRVAGECGGLLFRCCCCPIAWCEDHASKDVVPLRNDPQLQALGYADKSNAYYILCGSKECAEYFDKHVKIPEPAASPTPDMIEGESFVPLDELLSTKKEETKDEAKENAPKSSPRRSPRKHSPSPSPPPKSMSAAASAAAEAAAAAAIAAAQANSPYSKLSDRLRGRLKKLLARETEAAKQGGPDFKPNTLGEIETIAQRFMYMADSSTMLQALHYMIYDHEADDGTAAKFNVLAWRGLPVGSTKLDAGEFYERCWSELRTWKTSSVEQLSKILSLGTQSPPKLIKSGPLEGRMSHTEPRPFSIEKGELIPETNIRMDPLQCVMEHIICFLIAPRQWAQLLRFEYMARSVLKDKQWEDEVRIEKETGIPRPKKRHRESEAPSSPTKSSSAQSTIAPSSSSASTAVAASSNVTVAQPVAVSSSSTKHGDKSMEKKDKKHKHKHEHKHKHKHGEMDKDHEHKHKHKKKRHRSEGEKSSESKEKKKHKKHRPTNGVHPSSSTNGSSAARPIVASVVRPRSPTLAELAASMHAKHAVEIIEIDD